MAAKTKKDQLKNPEKDKGKSERKSALRPTKAATSKKPEITKAVTKATKEKKPSKGESKGEKSKEKTKADKAVKQDKVKPEKKQEKAEKPKDKVKVPKIKGLEKVKEAEPDSSSLALVPARRVTGKTIPDPNPAAAETPTPRKALFGSEASFALSPDNLETWKAEAKAKGLSLEDYMQKVSEDQLDASVEAHMLTLVEEAEKEAVADDMSECEAKTEDGGEAGGEGEAGESSGSSESSSSEEEDEEQDDDEDEADDAAEGAEEAEDEEDEDDLDGEDLTEEVDTLMGETQEPPEKSSVATPHQQIAEAVDSHRPNTTEGNSVATANSFLS